MWIKAKQESKENKRTAINNLNDRRPGRIYHIIAPNVHRQKTKGVHTLPGKVVNGADNLRASATRPSWIANLVVNLVRNPAFATIAIVWRVIKFFIGEEILG